MTHDQEYAIDALRTLLQAADPAARLDDNNARTLAGEDVFEVRIGGKHWGFVGVRDSGRVRLLEAPAVGDPPRPGDPAPTPWRLTDYDESAARGQ